MKVRFRWWSLIYISLIFYACSSASEFEPAERKEVRVLSDQEQATVDDARGSQAEDSDKGRSSDAIKTSDQSGIGNENSTYDDRNVSAGNESTDGEDHESSGNNSLPTPPKDTGKPQDQVPDPLAPKLQVRWSASENPSIMKWNVYIRENSPYLAADRELLEEVVTGQSLSDASDSYISLDIATHPILKTYAGKDICILVTALNEFGTSLQSEQSCLESL